ncbi:hypothetical protein TUM4261_32700 [Shewanella sp. c952]|uniref:hypothetical protein n=1 Tax=Shewanella sp. c952 TaxID=2815913 RepID=UPI001BBAC694|nr:hypothetical protein [Shewanella sp. c952]GIU15565.1 hypothetical protein TUM4261_32700 [Shewanella sp. c952]
MRALIIISVFLFTAPVMSEVYRCGDGVYQADPCDESSKPIDLSNVGSVVANENTLPTLSTTSESATAAKKSEISSYIRNRQIEREINKLESRREKVLVNRDQRMRELRDRGRYANNNLAGATWQQSLAQEMSAISQQADSEVSTLDRQIAQLRTRLN